MTGHDGTAKTSQGAVAYWTLADSQWANRYGWVVNHVQALMLLIVSMTHSKTASTINTKRSAATQDRCQTDALWLCLLWQQYSFTPTTEPFNWWQL